MPDGESFVAQVSHWAEEVAKHKRQRRPGLFEISYNLRRHGHNSFVDGAREDPSKKRKRPMDEPEPQKRGRGRPRKDIPASNSLSKPIPILGAQSRPNSALVTDQSQPSVSRRKSASPRKNAKHIDQSRAPTSIDMPFLGRCNPRVKRKSFQAARTAYNMPESVLNLHTRLQDIRLGFIPLELKAGIQMQLSLSRNVAELISRTLMRVMREHLVNQNFRRALSSISRTMRAPTLQHAYNL